MKFNPKAMGLAFGAFWAAVMFVTTLVSAFNGYATDFLLMMASIYPGYSLTYMGSIIGAIYGFIDGFVGGWVFAWLYNRFAKE